MKVGDIIDVGAIRCRVKSFHVDSDGVNVIDECELISIDPKKMIVVEDKDWTYDAIEGS